MRGVKYRPSTVMTIEKICHLDCTKETNREALFRRVNKVCKTDHLDLNKVLRGIKILCRKTGLGSVVATSYPRGLDIVCTASLHDVKKDEVVCTAIALDYNELLAKMFLVLLQISKQ